MVVALAVMKNRRMANEYDVGWLNRKWVWRGVAVGGQEMCVMRMGKWGMTGNWWTEKKRDEEWAIRREEAWVSVEWT